jgi:hypothetical protein
MTLTVEPTNHREMIFPDLIRGRMRAARASPR